MTAILGGGIGGLTAAYYALENPRIGAITLLEASNRVGGWIRTSRSPTGAVFEKGPRTIRPAGPIGMETLRIVDNLQLTDRFAPMSISQPGARTRLIYANNTLCVLPNSLGDLFKTMLPFKRPLISAIYTDWRAPKMTADDENLYSFASRRLGQDIADYFVSAMVCGIYAGDARQLSVMSLMPKFFAAEQEYGSILMGLIKNKWAKRHDMRKREHQEIIRLIKERERRAKERIITINEGIHSSDMNKLLSEKNVIKGQRVTTLAERARYSKWIIWTLDGGLEQLPEELKNYLDFNGVDIRLNYACESITFTPECVEVKINGQVEKFDKIVSSLPANVLASLVEQQHPDLASELKAIPYVTVGVVNLEYDSRLFEKDAFGFLIPPKENIPILGVIFDSCLQPNTNPNSTVLTVMMGGAWFEHYFGNNPTIENLSSIAIDHVKKISKVNKDPQHVDTSILKNCIPQHIVGHSKRIQRIRDYISLHGMPLALCGSFMEGVGVNDVILSAKNAIDDISQHQ